MKFNLLIACCCLGWAATAAGAPLTLEESLQRAERQSSSVKSFEMAAAAADELVTMRRAAFYPTLNLKASYSLVDNPDRLIIYGNSFGSNLPSRDVHLSTGDRDSYSVGLYLQQPLYTGGNLTHSRRRAEYELQAAQSDTAYQRSQLYQQVKKTFSEALAAELQLQALNKALIATREQARVIRERLQEGSARREDLLAAEQELSRTETAWTRAENQAEMTLSRLRKLINAAPDESIEPVGRLTKTRLTVPLNELQALGIQKRDDLKALQAKVSQSSADIAIARSSYFPQVSLVGSYQRQPETAIARSDVWKVGAQAEWNLFEWGRTAAGVRRALALERQESYRLEEERKNAGLEIEQFWRDVKDAESRLHADENALTSQEYTLHRILDRYREGLIKPVDFMQSEAALWNAYATYLQSAASLQTALSNLERASGTELTPWLTHAPLHQPAFDHIAARLERPAQPDLQAQETKTAETKPPEAGTDAAEMPAPARQPSGETYLLQIGAYKSQENAERAIQSLAHGGRQASGLTIVNESGLFKVFAGPFSHKEDALRAAADLGAKDFIVKVNHGS